MDTLTLPEKVEINGKTRYKFPKKDELKKDYSEYVERAKAQLKKHGLPGASDYNIMLVMAQVVARFPEHKNDAIPYLTVKTFNSWKKQGRKVKKGETAMQIPVWVHPIYEDEKGEKIEDTEVMYPKTAHVFGIWQTKEITSKRA